jgi:hypothetical protein
MTATRMTDAEIKAKAHAVVSMVVALGETIKEAGSDGVPEGVLYAALMTRGVSLESFNRMVNLLIKAGVVKRSNHLLTWIGPVNPPVTPE